MDMLCMDSSDSWTLVLRVGYDGGAYSGFAEQKDDVKTIAGELRCAIEVFLRRPVDLTCAGRTDAGVHAQSQYVSFPAFPEEFDIPRRRWIRAMDALLPRDITVNGVFRAGASFSARFDALSRTYVYRIVDSDLRPLQTRSFVWWHRFPLDDAAMNVAASYLIGEQDFKSFCKVSSAVGKSTCRNVISASLSRQQEFGEDILAFRIQGNAFLHNMVRSIVGTLVEVGMHRKDPEWVRDVIAARDRQAAGPTAPASGLTFVDVEYPASALISLE